MSRSKYFYIRIKGEYALFVDPLTKGGGEKVSYPIPTKQALLGIVDACYFKPTISNHIEEVRVINPIQTQVRGNRALIKKYSSDLNYYSYLADVEYLVKFYFTWNLSRQDLINDRNMKKHEAIMERSIRKGGRRDIFLGTRECVAYLDWISEDEFLSKKSYYQDNKISFGIMFNQFKYPTQEDEKLRAYYSEVILDNGLVKYKDLEDCTIYNEVSHYSFKTIKDIKPVKEEYLEYLSWEEK